MASKKPEVFSLGGDLAVFVAAIRGRDQGALLTYAYACIDVMYALTSGFGLPVVTLSAVAGQCMGGGFEGALATDFLIAEEGARLGVPEIGFNSFPGMGAVSFLQRRVGAVKAEDIIAGGAVYSPAQLFDLDLVDVVAPEGRLRETVQDWMLEGGEARWRRRLELVQLRRRCFPIEKEELLRIVELWAECSFAIAEPDLRHMERLVMAQRRLASRRGVQSQNQATSGGAPPQAPAGEG